MWGCITELHVQFKNLSRHACVQRNIIAKVHNLQEFLDGLALKTHECTCAGLIRGQAKYDCLEEMCTIFAEEQYKV